MTTATSSNDHGDIDVTRDLQTETAEQQVSFAPATSTTTTTSTTRTTSTSPSGSTTYTTSTTRITSSTSTTYTTSTTHTTKTTTLSSDDSVMDRLPLELAAMIMEKLVEYNIAQERYSGYTEDPRGQLSFQGTPIEPDTNWVKLTGQSRTAILNARKSCWKLYKASTTGFGTSIGDRKFRFTKTGIEDLERIAQQTALVPHITTLTIACGGFRNVDDMHRLREAVVELEVEDQNRLLEAYVQCAVWQGDSILDYQSKLASVLRIFPKLKAIRIDTLDEPKYLAGWLEVGDLHMLHLQDCLDQKTNLILANLLYYHEKSRMYRSNLIDAPHIIDALVLAETALEDLRIWGMDWDCFSDLKMQSFNLHTLRIDSCNYEDDILGLNPISTSYLDSALRSLPDLQDLSLNVNDPVKLWSFSSTFQILTKHTKLRRLSLIGDWEHDAPELIAMAEAQSRNLRCLVFNGVFLVGRWSTTL